MQNASDNKNNNSTTNRDSSLRFVPEAEEHSPELQALFDRISDRIDDFCSSSTLPHVQVNRFVAGHLRKNDVADLKLAFVSPEALRESEEKNKLGGSTKLAGCSDAAAVWASKSAAEKAAYKEMEITSKKEQSKKRRRREGDAGEPETIKIPVSSIFYLEFW
ncbi:hypothetical protein MUCCIDRAFT_114745 [Mucor lusitanicus CBS 277.49]|uniref:Uncharacterized protein n=1 Tax=Mucor lusitanicus CBS 277.49 TaxID=747725 RepID=A0A168I4U7_MUCCL|nr:hypothetical protein MUCCIDRAFT_114745 [Mucor lusitanicus CBS 277.49]